MNENFQPSLEARISSLAVNNQFVAEQIQTKRSNIQDRKYSHTKISRQHRWHTTKNISNETVCYAYYTINVKRRLKIDTGFSKERKPVLEGLL